MLYSDDTINGYTIPKDTTVILNVWGMHHDPSRKDPTSSPPDVFDPSRFEGRTLTAAEYAVSADFEKRDHYGYGAGRRICPGIHLAERNLFLGMAKLLWGFEFSEKETAKVDVDPSTGYSEGFLHCPMPFECEVKVRGPERQEAILREFHAAEKDVFAKYEAP